MSGDVIAVEFRPRAPLSWDPPSTGDELLDRMLLFAWATGRKVGIGDDPAPNFSALELAIAEYRRRGAGPLDEVRP